MDTKEKSLLIEVLLELKNETQLQREERAKQHPVHVHLKSPRVSLDTVVLSLASGLIAAATIYACVPK